MASFADLPRRLARSRYACLRGLATLPHVGHHPGVPYAAVFTLMIAVAIGQRLLHDGGTTRESALGGLVVFAGVAIPLWGIVLYGAADRARIADRATVQNRMNGIVRAVTDACSPPGASLAWYWEVHFHGSQAQVWLTDGRRDMPWDPHVPADVWEALPDLFARARVIDGRTVPKDLFSAMLATPNDGPASAHVVIARQQRMRDLLSGNAFEDEQALHIG